MILGLYWDSLPSQRYAFRYFTFKPAVLGHANIPATLTTSVETQNTDTLFKDIQSLWEKHPQALNLEFQLEPPSLNIILSDYLLYDYDFELAFQIENILAQYGATTTQKNFSTKTVYLRNSFERYPPKKNDLLQNVYGDAFEDNAKIAYWRLDVHVDELNKKLFLEQIKKCAQSSGITVCFYKEHKGPGYFNLMFFFTLGHQGVNLKPFVIIDDRNFETKLSQAIRQFDVKNGFHLNNQGLELYPKSENFFILQESIASTEGKTCT